MSREENLEYRFPNLYKYKYQILVTGSKYYNCLGLANNDRTRWWNYNRSGVMAHHIYWPPDVPQDWKVETLVLLFKNRGYEICESAVYESGFQKVAIYMNLDFLASHVSIMNKPEMWSSKLGKREEIEHESLQALAGMYPAYGWIAQILKRPSDYRQK